jgi:hypothetical protein
MLRAQHTATAVPAVGLRQEALPQCFLIATTANKVFQQSLIPLSVFSATSVFKTKLAPISEN